MSVVRPSIQKYGSRDGSAGGIGDWVLKPGRPPTWSYWTNGSETELAKAVARSRVLGADLEGQLELPRRAIAQPLRQEERTEVRVRFSVVGIDCCQSFEGTRGVRHPTQTRKVYAEIVEGILVIRVDV